MIKSKALVLNGLEPGNIEVLELDVNTDISDDELLLRNEFAGICGSDIHFYVRGGNKGLYVPGHELCGVVEKAGSNFRDINNQQLEVGDRVVVEDRIPCMECDSCKKVNNSNHTPFGYSLCENSVLLGGTSFVKGSGKILGAYSEYIHIPKNGRVYKIPANIKSELSVLAEPLAVALRAVKTADVLPGDNVLVMGPGPIGLLVIAALKNSDVDNILMSGLSSDKKRLELGKKLGAMYTINVDKENLSDRINDITKGNMVSHIIDASGSGPAMEKAVFFIRPGGIYTSLGGQHADIRVSISPDYMLRNKISLRFSQSGSNQFKNAIKIISSGKYPLGKIVTHICPPEEIDDVFKKMINKAGNFGKVLIDFRRKANNE